MMHILGIDTSSTDLSVCLAVDEFPLSCVCRYVKNSHAEHITQAAKLALELGGINADQITHIAVSTGPGSFTGLRIGLSFVKGFCVMTERRVLPLPSLMVLAHAVGYRQHKKIYTALDARQGRVHWGSFIWDDGCDINTDADNTGDIKAKKLRRLTGDRLSSPEELLNELTPNDILITDAMGYSRSTVFTAFVGKAQVIAIEKTPVSRALSCAALAYEERDNDSLWRPAIGVVPNYLQMSAAEEKRSCN